MRSSESTDRKTPSLVRARGPVGEVSKGDHLLFQMASSTQSGFEICTTTELGSNPPNDVTYLPVSNHPVPGAHQISARTDNCLPRVRRLKQRYSRFTTILRLVPELLPQGNKTQREFGFRRNDDDQIWILFRKTMDFQSIQEWQELCIETGVNWNEFLYPLARENVPIGGVILGRKGRKGDKGHRRRYLFLASLLDGFIYSLGEGTYAQQLGRLVDGSFRRYLITEDNFEIYFGQDWEHASVFGAVLAAAS